MLRGLIVEYAGSDKQVDSMVESICASADYIGSGTWVAGPPQRDLQFEFSTEDEADAAEKDVLELNSHEYLTGEGVTLSVQRYDADVNVDSCGGCGEPFTEKDIGGGRCLSCGRMIC